MFCVCCKLQNDSASRFPLRIDSPSPLQLPALSPTAQNPLSSNPYSELLASFRQLSQQPLCNLLEKEMSTAKGIVRDSKWGEDLEETNLSEQATEDEKLYRLLFRRIYIENYTADRLISEDIRLLERVYYPESLERILIETVDKTAIIYRSILKEKVQEIAACTTLGQQVNLRDFYHFFEEIIEIINTIIDYGKAIRTYSLQADTVLRYLESSGMVDPLHEVLSHLIKINEEWLHRRCMRTVLQEPFLKSICSLTRSILKTNTLTKYESKFGIEDLLFLVQCCFDQQSQQMVLSQSCTHFTGEQDQDDLAIQLMRGTTLNNHKLQCSFSSQFLKSIERKIRKAK